MLNYLESNGLSWKQDTSQENLVSYTNQLIDVQRKSVECFLYDTSF